MVGVLIALGLIVVTNCFLPQLLIHSFAFGDKDVRTLDITAQDAACAAPSASAISMPRSSRRATSIGPAAIRVRKVEPARYSMTIKLCPFASPISYSVQMLGMIDSRCGASFSAKTSYAFRGAIRVAGAGT